MTRTYVTLDVPYQMWEFVRKALLDAGYSHAIEDNAIDMHGIALTPIDRLEDEKSLLEVTQDSRGNHLYRKENGVGGHTYWSDEIGGGVVVWDTSLVSREMLELAIRDMGHHNEEPETKK